MRVRDRVQDLGLPLPPAPATPVTTTFGRERTPHPRPSRPVRTRREVRAAVAVGLVAGTALGQGGGADTSVPVQRRTRPAKERPVPSCRRRPGLHPPGGPLAATISRADPGRPRRCGP